MLMWLYIYNVNEQMWLPYKNTLGCHRCEKTHMAAKEKYLVT